MKLLSFSSRSRMCSSRLLIALSALLALWSPRLYAAPYTEENGRWNTNRAIGEHDPIRYYGEWPGHSYFPSPRDWRNIAIYSVVLDRFRDGDPHNNDGLYGGYSSGDVHLRHGGDFRGITERLDYIKGLGFSAIALSPIFQNPGGNPSGGEPVDFTLIDDRLGTLEELRTLVTEAHRRSMYVVVDLTLDHLSSRYYPQGYKRTVAPFRLHQGEYPLLPRFKDRSYADFSVSNSFDAQGRYCDVYGLDGERHEDTFGEGSFWASDFHHLGGNANTYTDPWQMQLGMPAGRYDDLRLCSERVQQKLLAMISSLISSTDIDAVRVGNPRSIPRDFLNYWAGKIRAHARKLGKENFLLVGDTQHDGRYTATIVGRGKTPSMYGRESAFIDQSRLLDGGMDYDFADRIILPLLGSKVLNTSYFSQFLSDQDARFDQALEGGTDTRWRMINYFNTSTTRRLQSGTHGIARARAASVIAAFWRGIPAHYYGDEQGFSSFGTGTDGHAREDMMTGLAWRSHPSNSSPNRASFDNFDMASEGYRFVSRVYNLRAALSGRLANNSVRIDAAQEVPGGTLLVFSRGSSPSKSVQILVNASPHAINPEVTSQVAPHCNQRCSLVDLLAIPAESIEVDSGKFTSLALAPYQSRILVNAEEQVALPLMVTELAPAHDTVVPEGALEVKVTFSEPVRKESLFKAIRFRSRGIEASKIIAIDDRSMRLSLSIPEGISYLEIGKGVISLTDRSLPVPFRARFRSGRAKNVVADHFMDRDDSLINGGSDSSTSPRVALHHSATGASYMRFKNEPDLGWSSWIPYQSDTFWTLNRQSGGWKGMAVQYWIDGSASYYVKDGIDLVLPSDYVIPEEDSTPVTQIDAGTDTLE